ncbi:MAG: hypothetical protein II037_12455, partial [Bacteroidales bacterium]|nr:hypothetical protein [Bacteroidales bacterium]
MKKLLVVLAAAGLLFAMSSCDKTCTCKSFLAGNVVTESEVELDKENTNIKKCSDMNTYVT